MTTGIDNVVALASLAMLKVNLDAGGKDYIDYFVPFIGFLLNRDRPDPVTTDIVKELLAKEFRLNVPSHPTEYALRRLAEQGFLRKDNYVYRFAKPYPVADLHTRRETMRQRYEQILHRLGKFAAGHQIEWSDSDSTNALLSYLRRFSIECLRTYTKGSPLPDTPPLDQRGLYTVSLFVKSLYESDRQAFDRFIDVVKGHMLANALVCSDLKSISRNFGAVIFYFDTPLVLRLLNLEGDAKRVACNELIELIQALKGQCAVFDHTFEESKSVIDADERNLDNPAARGRVIEEIRRRGITKSDLFLMSQKLEDLLKEKGLSRRRTPRYVGRNQQFQIDEALLESSIRDEITYMNPRAIEFDINSIRSIYALRQGKAPSRIEDAGAVLVTSNAGLARATFEYGREHESTRAVSAVVTDFSLANVAWLKAPLKAPELPELEVMAACYAALEPPTDLWTDYVAEIDKLQALGTISADDHQLLRYSQPARSALMNLTGGSEVGFSAKTVHEVLARMRADVREELLADHQKALEADRASLEIAARDQHRVREQLESEVAETQRTRTRADQEIAEAIRVREKTEKTIEQFAFSVGVGAKWIALLVLALIAAISVITEVAKDESIIERVTKIGVPVLILAGLLTYCHLVRGISAWEIAEHVQRFVQRSVQNALRRRILVADDTNTEGPVEL
jgi:hypothetical protein